jgi:hypothetical protein
MKKEGRIVFTMGGAQSTAAGAGAYHLLTIVHFFKPHLSCVKSLFTTTEAT